MINFKKRVDTGTKQNAKQMNRTIDLSYNYRTKKYHK